MKIGYLMQADSVPMTEISGPQLHVKAVVEGLKLRGHQVRVVAIQENQIQWSDNLKDWQSVTFTFSKSPLFRVTESIIRGVQSRLQLPFFRFFDSYRFSDACATALSDYDILYERFGILSYGGLITSKRLDIPIMLELNGDLLEEYRDLGIELPKAQWRIIRTITRWMYHKADHLVPVSNVLAERIIHHWQVEPAKVTAVANGANVDIFVDDTRDTESIRQKYSLNGSPVITLVSSFEPWHGVDLLLEAFVQLRDRFPEAALLLVGDGRLHPEMQNKAAELGLAEKVIFTGLVSQEEVAAIMKLTDVAVIYNRGSKADISLSPLKLFEYMAAGKAIVAPTIPAIEAILTHGITGYLIPPGESSLLAEAIAHLLDNNGLRKDLGETARKQAIEKHSWEQTVTQIETIMFELIGKNRVQ